MLHKRLILKFQICSMCGERDKFGAGLIERLERWSGRRAEATFIGCTAQWWLRATSVIGGKWWQQCSVPYFYLATTNNIEDANS
jgi:hypothetical protein